jgi:hypothetical protein
MKNPQSVEDSVAQYTLAWNEKGQADIRAAIEKCCDVNVSYIDAHTPLVRGIDGITALIVKSYEQMPVRTFVLPAPPECHNNLGRYRWLLLKPGETDHEGMDFFEYNEENKITRIVGFLTSLV